MNAAEMIAEQVGVDPNKLADALQQLKEQQETEDIDGGIRPNQRYVREMAKWDKPYRFQQFPAMVYRASDDVNGKIACDVVEPNPGLFSNEGEYNHAVSEAKAFRAKCQRLVNDERELQAAYEAGFRDDPVAACDFLRRQREGEFNEMAEAAHRDQGMSEAARAEREAYIDAQDEPTVPVIPESPLPAKRQCLGKLKSGAQCKKNATDAQGFCKTHKS